MDVTIRLKERVYYSIEEFAREIYLFPNEAFAMIKSQKFLKILYKYNEKMYNNIAELLNKPFQQDALLFQIQYILNPLMELRHHGYLFKDFQSLGKKIISYGPATDIYLKDFLKYRLLSYYMKVTRYDEKAPVLFQKVLKLEEEYPSNENRAYFKLGFLLEGSGNIVYRDKKFTDIREFLSYVTMPVNITDFSASFIKSQYLLAWLEHLGYVREITLFENLVLSVEQKERKNDNLRKV